MSTIGDARRYKLIKPDKLVCPYCGRENRYLHILNTLWHHWYKPEITEYKWRELICKWCIKRVWWGDPLIGGKPHLVMTTRPRFDSEGRVKNIEEVKELA